MQRASTKVNTYYHIAIVEAFKISESPKTVFEGKTKIRILKEIARKWGRMVPQTWMDQVRTERVKSRIKNIQDKFTLSSRSTESKDGKIGIPDV